MEYSPRSYLVDTERDSILRRNRQQLKFLHSHSAVVHNGGGVRSTDPVPHNVVITRGEEEILREQQEAAVDPQEQERTLQVLEESVESVPNLNKPNAPLPATSLTHCPTPPYLLLSYSPLPTCTYYYTTYLLLYYPTPPYYTTLTHYPTQPLSTTNALLPPYPLPYPIPPLLTTLPTTLLCTTSPYPYPLPYPPPPPLRTTSRIHYPISCTYFIFTSNLPFPLFAYPLPVP